MDSSGPIDDCSFDILTQVEKKADFLHSAVEQYIQDAKLANKPELESLWNTIKRDEERHFQMLKKEMVRTLDDNTARD